MNHRMLCAAALPVLSLLLAFASAAAEPAAPGIPPAPKAQQPFASPFAIPDPPPALSHEKNPQSWPQPDYFSQALAAANLKAGARFKSLSIQTPERVAGADAIVLPAQTQAFAFAPAFRAIAAAELEWLLVQGGTKTTGPTALTDAYGPFVKRLDGDEIDRLAARYPRQKLVVLYIGHDGIDRAFLTLEVRNTRTPGKAHTSIVIPDDVQKALALVTAALPALAKEAGLATASSRPAQRTNAGCDIAAWDLAGEARNGNGLERACRALAVGSLMPPYRMAFSRSSGVLAPATRAWLAEAYVQASHVDSDAAEAIRALSAGQIGIANTDAFLSAYLTSKDPVVSRVATLLGRSPLARSPVRSADAAFEERAREAAKDLPAFTRALFDARTAFGDGFGEVDTCSLESTYSEPPFASSCGSNKPADSAGTARRPATDAEHALYQDWRIAARYREISRYAKNLGQSERARKAIDSLPAEVASHPFIAQLLYETEHELRFMGGADLLQAHGRKVVGAYVQSIADSQTDSPTLLGYSMAGHTWSANLGAQDDPVNGMAQMAEMRLLAELTMDRFGTPGTPAKLRAQGEGAKFLSNRMSDLMNAHLRPTPTDVAAQLAKRMQASPPVKTGAFPAEREAFPLQPAMFSAGTPEELAKEVQDEPRNMNSRVALAIARLQHGAPLAEAKAIIDAYPRNDRIDYRIGESHAWAKPAHAFYFAGELEAAKRYYANSAAIGTGSSSEMQAYIRIALVEDRLRDAEAGMVRILDRYESDFAARDMMGMLFLRNQPEPAWRLFLERAPATKNFQLWVGSYVGHRRQRMDLAKADAWLKENKLDAVRISVKDISLAYLRMLAVTDRLPSEADIDILRTPRGRTTYVDKLHEVSARLIRGAMEPGNEKAAHEFALPRLAKYGDVDDIEIAPFYAWSAWIATNGADPKLKNLRDADLDQTFDHLLAKAVILALEGKKKESLSYFRAARFKLSILSNGDMSDRAVQAPYEVALIGFLISRRTGDAAFRQETLRFVRAYQKIFPYLGWPYSIDAALETERAARTRAACRAQYLDPDSYFLKLSKVDVAKAACAGQLWK